MAYAVASAQARDLLVQEGPMTQNPPIEISWEQLRRAAQDAKSRAYAPYSQHPVGAAALTNTGRIVSGCNVENASYGITLCAECGLVSELIKTSATGSRETLIAFACVGPHQGPLLPCGRCRQLLMEHADPSLLIDTERGPSLLTDLLPFAFGPKDLPNS